MICVDNNFLVLLIKPDLTSVIDPATGVPTERIPERIELLQETWEKDNEVILIPDPALAEFLMFADEDADRLFYLNEFRTKQSFEIKPFDTAVAIELAAMYIREKREMSNNKRKELKAKGTKTHMSFDRQIVAIAKFHSVTAIYSDDKGVKAFGDIHGVKVVRTFELPLPPEPYPEPEVRQSTLFGDEELDATVASEDAPDERKTDNVIPIEFHGSDGSDAENKAGNGEAEPSELEKDFEAILGFTDKLEEEVGEEKPKATSESGLGKDGS